MRNFGAPEGSYKNLQKKIPIIIITIPSIAKGIAMREITIVNLRITPRISKKAPAKTISYLNL